MKKYLMIGIFLVTTSLQAENYNIKLVKEMCRSIPATYGINCPVEIFKIAIKKGCKKIVTNKNTNLNIGIIAGIHIEFGESDPYSNKNECYIFAGDLMQRINKTSGLFSGDKGMYLLKNLPKGRYSEGKTYLGVTKGNGMFQYETVGGGNKTVSKGSVISIIN